MHGGVAIGDLVRADASDEIVLGWRDDDGLHAVTALLPDYPRPGTGYLGFMLVDANRRSRGIGRSIYAVLEDWAETSGANEIRFAVLEANGAGERFWRSLGFVEVGPVGPDTSKMPRHRRIELRRDIKNRFAPRGHRQPPWQSLGYGWRGGLQKDVAALPE